MDAELVRLLSDADRAVAELKGASRTLPSPNLFVAMYVRKEAVLSSQIEGTQSSLDDVLRAEARIADTAGRTDVGEVLNYISALNHGLKLLEELPVSGRLMRSIHERLMRDVRGGDKRPGEYRNGQVHIGPAGAGLTDATFVPPPWQHVPNAMADLERFVNDDGEFPPLIRIGLAHSQFETIHPFHDGNGRTGRLLITFLLCKERLLDRPVLYLSHFLKAHRNEYYDALQGTRDSGDYESWLKFFLRGVAKVAMQAASVAASIGELRERHRTAIAEHYPRASKNAFALLDQLFVLPLVRISDAAERLEMTQAGAGNLVGQFVELGILREITGYGRNRVFDYADYRSVFDEL
jgi:Fic family protein